MNHVIIPEMDNVKLRYDFNAICEIEDTFGSLENLFKEKRIFNSTRALLWIGMKWDRDKITIKEAGVLITSYLESGKTLENLSEHINNALIRGGVVKAEEVSEAKN